MNISLTPELEKYIHEKVNSGLYTSVSEVIRESLRLMHTYDDLQQQRINQLNHEIELGLMQLASGQKIPASEVYQQLKEKIQKIHE
jgi:antitoxin ParD1/3/4